LARCRVLWIRAGNVGKLLCSNTSSKLLVELRVLRKTTIERWRDVVEGTARDGVGVGVSVSVRNTGR
jgi:hypothetical protein